jgi:segregation and condensation protein B
VIEAALLAAGRPLPVADLAQLFDESNRPDNDAIRAGVAELAASYEGRGIEVKETASGVRVQVRQEFAGEVARLWPERPQRYSRALLETLALIAYRQPITRAEIESVRGVAVNPNILKTLMERNWVRVVGHRDVPGHPELLGTARDFLDYFGLKSLDDLPPLAELKAMGDLNMQLPLPGTAEGSGDEVPLVTPAADDAAVGGDAGDQAGAVDAVVTFESTAATEGGVSVAESTVTVVTESAVAAAAAPEGDLLGLVAALEEAGADEAAFDDDLLDDEDLDDQEDGGEDEALSVRIEAVGFEDDLADLDGDGDSDPDEQDAAGPEAPGLVAAPPARDD